MQSQSQVSSAPCSSWVDCRSVGKASRAFLHEDLEGKIADSRESGRRETDCRERLAFSDGLKEPDREEDDGAHHFQHASYCNSNQAEWQQKKPHNRVKHQRQQSQRPAQNQQNAPQQKLDHGFRVSSTFIYGRAMTPVPPPRSFFLTLARAASSFSRSRSILARSFSGIAKIGRASCRG